jgi:hypothetical protein
MGKTFGATTAAMLVVSIGLVAAPKDQTEKFHDAAMVLREIHGRLTRTSLKICGKRRAVSRSFHH